MVVATSDSEGVPRDAFGDLGDGTHAQPDLRPEERLALSRTGARPNAKYKMREDYSAQSYEKWLYLCTFVRISNTGK